MQNINREDAPHLSDEKYNALILALGTLREAIKNLNEENEKLQKELDDVMIENDNLRNEVDRLKDELSEADNMIDGFLFGTPIGNPSKEKV